MGISNGLYTSGPVGPTISDETVALVRQAMADTTRSITMTSGLLGYELEAPAKVVVPVITPLVNMLPRRKGAGVELCIGRRSRALIPRATGACWRTAARRARCPTRWRRCRIRCR